MRHGDWKRRWDEVEEYWPRRLLHIPTLTSIERQGFATYLGTEAPEYNILSYTWGRWMVEHNVRASATALPVKGTPWVIPAVKEEHFTVAAFQNVVDRLGEGGCEWAWIDIACIDQDDDDIKADEVGKQASIFMLASRVYVWLSHLGNDHASGVIQDLEGAGIQLGNLLNRGAGAPAFELVQRIHRQCKLIFGDPWFSSLWTLQEFFLRIDSKILSSEGIKIARMVALTSTCGHLYKDLQRLAEMATLDWGQLLMGESQKDKDLLSMAKEVRDLLQQTGFRYRSGVSNPNVQYGIARSRKTSRPEDRVYAIMQAYNLRVGRSVRPGEHPGLKELSDEFAFAINAKCPILGQMFNHEERPPNGKSWAITESSSVPGFLLHYDNPRPQCKVRRRSDGAFFIRGKCVSFGSLARLLESKTKFFLNFSLSLDGVRTGASAESEDGNGITAPRVQALSTVEDDIQSLLQQFRVDEICVLLLGEISQNLSRSEHIGLVVCQERCTNTQGGHRLYRRLGVCTWRSHELRQAIGGLRWVKQELQFC